jgi:hypothetical protein
VNVVPVVVISATYGVVNTNFPTINAAAMASYYQGFIPDGIASITASGTSLVFTCKSGYGMSDSAINLGYNGKITDNQDGIKVPSSYNVVRIINGSQLSNRSKAGVEAYNQRGGAPEWGVNCYLLA